MSALAVYCDPAALLSRTVDAERVNALANHPSIRPHIGGDGVSAIDLSVAVADPRNVFLLGEHGGFCFCRSAPGAFEVHTFVMPSGRGGWAAEAALEARAWMAAHGARHLWTRVHPEAANVRAFTLKAGFAPAGTDSVDLGAGAVEYDLFEWRNG